MKSEVEFLRLSDGETDETALERFKIKMIALGKEINVINSRRICSKLMKVYFVEVISNNVEELAD